ncbi:hypothetical protein KI809_14780 [Geobacter pelophilus]|uniref:Secreted protein n=1 Tax=Geoanaerobacter pelophilus TaxID=60036 RepID=A0AAW4LB21_9BACT|nr:hypothetical protein [Geoanaerobacter pelophilus]MBT0665571.1 hypothetical protein [Geoanaerobacter pelophilus]
MNRAVIAILVIVSLIASVVGGLCSDVHPDAHCSLEAGSSCAKISKAPCSSTPCNPDHDGHSDDGHCDDCCGCSCNRSVVSTVVYLHYSPLVTTLSGNEPSSVFPEVFIPKFVPPESLA